MGYKLIKKDENKYNCKHWDKDKTKSTYNLSLTNTNQSQAQASKNENKHHYGNYWGDYPVTEVNTIKVAKKDKNKDKAKHLNHIEYYTYKQKSYYTNKCFEKPKN